MTECRKLQCKTSFHDSAWISGELAGLLSGRCSVPISAGSSAVLTGFPYSSSVRPGMCRDRTLIMPRPFPYTPSPIYILLFIPSFEGIYGVSENVCTFTGFNNIQKYKGESD
jgi:hypothetical protein